MEGTGITRREKNLVVAFVQFIRQKLATGSLPEDQVESLEGTV